MKKLIVLVSFISAISISNSVFAQYKQGNNLVNLGLGLNSYFAVGLPLSASYEYGFTPQISGGAVVDYVSANNLGVKFSSLFFGARGSYHLNELLNINDDKWDIYGGASLGYRSLSASFVGTFASGVFFGVHAGARYYFSESVGAFTEAGFGGSSNLRLGITFKF